MSKPVVVQTTRTRDVVLGVAIGLLVLGFVIYGIMSMSNRVMGNDLIGTITAKHFTPQAEEQQITLGKGGLNEKTVTGEYRFEVQVPPENKIYTVWVDKVVYDARNVGEEFRFPRPAPAKP